MKVLIGTPIDSGKDYALERWLESVVKLDYPADLLVIDTSEGTDYIERVKKISKKLGLTLVDKLNTNHETAVYKATKNYMIQHLEIGKYQPTDEKVGRSRELIREFVLANDYDAWFSWESDQIIPAHTLKTLINIMGAGDYSMVHPNSWSPGTPPSPVANLECCLVKRWCLEQSGFTLEFSEEKNNWTGNDVRFKKNVLKSGGNYIEIYGIIKPIEHIMIPNK